MACWVDGKIPFFFLVLTRRQLSLSRLDCQTSLFMASVRRGFSLFRLSFWSHRHELFRLDVEDALPFAYGHD